MSDFKEVKTFKKQALEKRSESTSEEDLKDLMKSLETKKAHLKNSKLYSKVFQDLQDKKFSALRCLALGSPAQDLQAIYQLALIILLVEDLDINTVSLYDPVFAPLDHLLFQSLGFKAEQEFSSESNEGILFFLPHAPLSLTNEFLVTQKPKYLLANNFQSHTDRVIATDLFEKYPLLSKAVSLLDPMNKVPDGFETVVKKKRNRKKHQSDQNRINYDSIGSHFDKVDLISYKDLELDGPWLNSFTDLSLHVLTNSTES